MHKCYEAGPQESGQRLDRYLAEQEPEISRSYLQKLIREGCVLADGKPVKAGMKLSPGTQITLSLPEAKEPEILPEELPLDILYEDSDVILINKPKGMVVHPSAGHYTGTLVNALLFHCQGELSGINGVLRPGIVHRIDKDTTGVLIACKNDRAHNALAEQLKDHTITRRYRAVVCGNLKEDEGTVEVPAHVAEMHPNGFVLSVEGDCMDRAYPDGCVVLVDPDAQPWNGCAVVAETSPGESVLRRYMRGSSTLMLSPDSHNGDHEDMVFADEEAQEVRTLGVVVWFQADHDEFERW